jgi:hypothetical protein
MMSDEKLTKVFEVELRIGGVWRWFTTYAHKEDALALAKRLEANGDTTRVVSVQRKVEKR